MSHGFGEFGTRDNSCSTFAEFSEKVTFRTR